MTQAKAAISAGTITVVDPETKGEVELEVLKDPVTGAMFAVDISYLEQVSESINSPFNNHRLRVAD